MAGKPDPKPRKRARDPQAALIAKLREQWCVVCGEPVGSAHHILPRSRSGDDCAENLVGLCGSGTTGCHGKVEAGDRETRRVLAAYLLMYRPDTSNFLRRELLHETPRQWIERVYG